MGYFPHVDVSRSTDRSSAQCNCRDSSSRGGKGSRIIIASSWAHRRDRRVFIEVWRKPDGVVSHLNEADILGECCVAEVSGCRSEESLHVSVEFESDGIE